MNLLRFLPTSLRAAAPIAPALALLAASMACGPHETPSTGAAGRGAIEVRTARVGGEGGDWVEVPGTVEAAKAAALASRHSAVIERVAVEEGDAVRAGDLLIRLDGRDLAARLQAAEAGLQAARAQRDRIRDLLAREAATRQELETAEAAHAAALAERDAARVQLDYVEIRAPFDGRIAEKQARAGDLARPGETLLSLQGAGLLRISATVSERQAATLKVGQPIDAIVEDGSAVSTRLSVLGPAGDPASRRFLVKTDLPRGSRAHAGSFARLRLPHVDEESQPLVPRRALVERGALTGVFIVDQGVARLRWISPGEPAGDAVVVRAGLKPGEEIVLDPGALADGDLVKVLEPAAEKAP